MTNDIINRTKLEAFHQHWEQIRHIERLRLTFSSFYALIVTAIIVYVIEMASDGRPFFIILVVLSLMGLLLCIRTSATAVHHRDKACHLARELTGIGSEEELKRYVPFSKGSAPWYNPYYIRTLYIWLFSIATSVFIFLAIFPTSLSA